MALEDLRQGQDVVKLKGGLVEDLGLERGLAIIGMLQEQVPVGELESRGRTWGWKARDEGGMENLEEGLGQDWKLSGTESLEGVLVMMEGGIYRKWESGGGI